MSLQTSNRLPETERLLADLISYATVSADPNRALIDHMAGLLEYIGARVTVQADESGTKANLFATLGPEGDGTGGILLSGHSDVVPVTDQDWTSDPFALTTRDDHLFGRGTCDMKGFIAACLAMAPAYAETPLSRPLHLAFTHDEEVGCLGARALVPELAERGIRPSMAIIGEPTGMRIIEGHKGCCEYTARFTGLEGHGSSPDRGVNAVLYAIRYATRLMELAEDLKTRARPTRFDPPWTTISIGRIGGGHAHNVIPGKAELDWEMRPIEWHDADYVLAAMTDHCETVLLPAMRAVSPEADITLETIGEVIGLMPVEPNLAREMLAELTGQNGADLVPFGTEAGLFQSLGTHVVVCGPGEIAQAHKPDEFVTRAQLAACLDMLDGIGQRIAA